MPNYADQSYGAAAANPPSPTASDHAAEGITYPSIDELLEKSGSKYQLVLYAAKRARQINAYYAQLGEGLLEYVGPLVETHVQEKPLSVAMREINANLLSYTPGADDPEPAVRPTLDAAAADAAFDDVLPDRADPFAVADQPAAPVTAEAAATELEAAADEAAADEAGRAQPDEQA